MFFDPTLAQYEESGEASSAPEPEEEAVDAKLARASLEDGTAAEKPEKAPAAEKAPAPAVPTPAGEGAGMPPAPFKDATTRVVSTIERVQVELQASSVPGGKEQIALPDGRVVEFQVPQEFTAGDVIEVEVGRTAYVPGAVNAANAAAAPVTRDQLVAFFQGGIAAMTAEATRATLSAPNAIRPGPQLIELQQKELDKLGIPRQQGCAAASQVHQTYATDTDLLELQKQFMLTAQREYLGALERLKPPQLERRLLLPRKVITEFFDACNTKMALPETIDVLSASFAKTKEPPNKLIIEMQRDMLETLGYDRDHACNCLNRISADFPNDEALGRAMQVWAMTAQSACKNAMSQVDPDLAPDSKQMKEMGQIQVKAQAKLATMSHAEKGDFLDGMRKKVEVFQKLSTADRLRYVSKLPENDKLNFVMSQILLMQQFQAMQASGMVPGGA